MRWLGSKVVDAETFDELLKHLDEQWIDHDDVVRGKREEAARALLHAEQRNLLAQKLAAEFTQAADGLDVADFVIDFLKGSWSPGGGRGAAQLRRRLGRPVRLPGDGRRPDLERAEEHRPARPGAPRWCR